MIKLTRREFLRDTALTGATLTLANFSARRAFARQTPTLSLDLVIWPSLTRTCLPWTTSDPRQLSAAFCHMLWSNIQASGRDLGRLEAALKIWGRKTSVIGHASLVATMRHSDGRVTEEIFSHTGGYPGFYRNPYIIYSGLPFSTDRYPDRYQACWFCFGQHIMIVFYIGEVLAGHTQDGSWETRVQYRKRMSKNSDFRSRRYIFRGDQAQSKYNLLKKIKRQTKGGSGIGAPRYYGLNRTSVRVLDNFNNSQPMSPYWIDGSRHEFHGGCANAVASVLEAVGLGNIVPSEAKFTIRLDLQRFQNVPLPVITNSRGFSKNGKPMDKDLIAELDRVPASWGNGDIVSFVDPNYWYRHFY